MGLTLLWTSGKGDFPLGVNMGSDFIPPKLIRTRVYTEVKSVHTRIPSHRLKRSWHSCPRQVNAEQQKYTQHTPSTKTECDYPNGWIKKQSHMQKLSPNMVNLRDLAGNAAAAAAEEEEEEESLWLSFSSPLQQHDDLYQR